MFTYCNCSREQVLNIRSRITKALLVLLATLLFYPISAWASDTVPPTIGTPTVSNITASGAKISVVVTDTTPSKDTIRCRVNYCDNNIVNNCTPENYLHTPYTNYLLTGSTFAWTLSGLYSSSTYRYDIQCNESAGNATTSSIRTLTTLAQSSSTDTALPSIGTPTVSNITQSSANISVVV